MYIYIDTFKICTLFKAKATKWKYAVINIGVGRTDVSTRAIYFLTMSVYYHNCPIMALEDGLFIYYKVFK